MKEAKKGKLYFGWWIVFTGFMIMAIPFVAAFSTMGLFLKPVSEELEVTRTALSSYFTLEALAVVICSLFMGKVLEKYNIKLIMTVSALGLAGTLVSFSLATQVTQFYVTGALMGVCFVGLTTLPISILINNWFGPKNKGKAIGLAMVGSGVGSLLMSPLISYIITTSGWRMGYRTMAVLVLAIVPLIFYVVAKTPEEKGVARLEDEGTQQAGGQLTGMTVKEASKTSALWLLLVGLFFFGAVGGAATGHIVPYLTDIGFSPMMAANIFAVAYGLLVVGKLLLGYLSDKIGIRAATLLGTIACTISMGALYMTMNVSWFVFIFVVLFGIGGAVGTISPPLVVDALFGKKSFGALLGFTAVLNALGAGLGPVFASKVYDTQGSYASVWLGSTCLLIIAGIFFVFCFRFKNKSVAGDRSNPSAKA